MGLLMVLLGWFYKPLRFLPKGNYIQVFMIIISLWCYTFLTGASPSVIREATMFSLSSIGTYLKRSPPSLYLLLLSFGELTYINPLYIKQLGFQMSYLAVFGILILQSIFVKLLPPKEQIIRSILGDDNGYAGSSNSSKSISYISFPSVSRLISYYQLGGTPFCCSLPVFRNW